MIRRVHFCTLLFALVFAGPARGQIVQTTAPPQAQAGAPDFNALSQEALGWLQDLVRINTTSPPGNELPAAKYVADVLTKEGIPNEILEMTPTRSMVVGRLNASAMSDPSRALLLLAHLDVVGVSRDKWSVDPFAAVMKDGYIYGRGTIDDKGMLAANLAAIVALKRGGVALDRDVIFLADDDEEQGGEASIKPAIAKYWDKFACGICAERRRPRDPERRQGAVRWHPGQREGTCKRNSDCHGNVWACVRTSSR